MFLIKVAARTPPGARNRRWDASVWIQKPLKFGWAVQQSDAVYCNYIGQDEISGEMASLKRTQWPTDSPADPCISYREQQGLKTPGTLGIISTTKITTAQRSSSQGRFQCYLQVQCAQKRGRKNQIIPHLWSQSEPCGESASWFDPP